MHPEMTGGQVDKPRAVVRQPGGVKAGDRGFGMSFGVRRAGLKDTNVVGGKVTAHNAQIGSAAEKFGGGVNTAFHAQHVQSCAGSFMHPETFAVAADPDAGGRVRVAAAQIAQTFAQFVHAGVDD